MKEFSKFSILIIVFLIVSCKSNETSDSDKVVQTEIYQTYSVYYDASSQTQSISASFRFGGNNGTTLRLVKNSKVSWNSQEMHEESSIFSGTYYEIKKVGDVIPENKFLYIDNDEKNYQNIIPLLKAEPLLEGNVLSKQNDNTINWVGLPSTANDEVKIIVKDSLKEYYFYPKIKGTSNMVIKGSELKDVVIGNANLQIRRTVTSSLQNGNAIGGEIYSEYLSKPINIKITQ